MTSGLRNLKYYIGTFFGNTKTYGGGRITYGGAGRKSPNL